MEQYIPKAAVVAEIDNRIKKYTLLQQKPEMSDLQEELQNKIDCINSIKGYILNTLEVKEVDLEKEIDKFYGMHRKNGITFLIEDNQECLDWKVDCNPNFVKAFAKHFFELGLKAQKGK